MRLRYSEEPLRDLLLRSLQGDALNERPQAADWIKNLAEAFRNDLGLLALHGKTGLAEQLPDQPLIRLPLCAADNLILLLSRNATQAQKHMGIAVPPGTVMLPMLIVCKMLLGDLLDQAETLGQVDRQLGIKERGGILLVSPDTEMRARYFSMRVGSESVVTSYPACRMRPDGSIAPVLGKQNTEDSGQFSVCFFLAHQKVLPNPGEIAFRPAVVILDLTHDRWIDRMSELIDWCIQVKDKRGEQATLLVILPLGDKLSRDTLSNHDIPIFPLDSTGIDEIVEGFTPIPPPADKYTSEVYSAWSFSAYAIEKPLDRKHTIYHVPDEAASDVRETITNIYQALDSISEKHAHRDLRLAGWLVGTLMQMPIPIEWYEQHAYLMGNRQTLKKLIAGIGSNIGGTLHMDIAPVLQSLRGHLELLYTRLSSNNPKCEAFLQYYHDHLHPLLAASKEVVVLARNDVIARALGPWLLSEDVDVQLQSHLHALTYKQVDGRETFDHLIATGPWPSRYRWQIGGRLAHAVDFLLYRGEEAILAQQMQAFYGKRTHTFFRRSRFSTLKTFGSIEAAPQWDVQNSDDFGFDSTDRHQNPKIGLALQQDSKFNKPSVDIDEDVTSLFDLVLLNPSAFTPADPITPPRISAPAQPSLLQRSEDLLYDYSEEPDGGGDEESIAIGGLTEPCTLLKVRMTNTQASKEIGYLYLSTEGTTDCYIPGQGDDDLVSVANEEIEPGFILIRTDQEDRQTLFDRILQLADAQPTMKYLKVWRQYWLEAIDRLVQKHADGRAKRGTYQQLQAQLAKVGVRVSNMTIRNWVLGETIGPGSLTSIKAIGLLSQHPTVQQYPEQVDAAFRQIRTIHQALGRRISTRLQTLGKVVQQGQGQNNKGGKTTKREIQLDPALSVPIDDLLDLLQFWEVVEIDQGPFEVPIARVGRVLTGPSYGGYE